MLSKQIDFFLVGAPKCGTTSIYDALSQHPEIFMPREKELHFFAPDFYPDDYITWEQYDKQFHDFSHELVMGEGSVWYLYSEAAPRLIHHYNSNAKILIAIRNPNEMIYSLHSQYVFDNVENFTNLIDALEHEKDRRAGKQVPDTVYNPRVLYYSELINYYDYVRRYIEVFGKQKIHVILYDEFVTDSVKAMRDIYHFLEVDPSFLPEIRTINSRKEFRSHLLRAFINPPFRIKNFARKCLPFPMRRSLIKIVNRLNTKNENGGQAPDLSEYLLTDQHRNNLIRLGELIDKDLTSWVKN